MKSKLFSWHISAFLILFIALFLFSAWTSPHSCESAIVTKLYEVCGPSDAVENPVLPVECAPGSVYINLDEECTSTIPVSIFLTNVVSDPVAGVEYDIPTGIDDFYIEHEAGPGLMLMSGPYNKCVYKGTIPHGPNDSTHMFGIDLNLPTYETTEVGCDPRVVEIRTFTVPLRVYRSIGVDEYEIYPLEPHSDPDHGIFSCRVFHETACKCDEKPCSVDEPIYDLNVCLDCHCTKEEEHGRLADQNLASNELLSDVSVTPNPFSDNFQVDFQIQKTSMVTMQLVDIQGKVMLEDKRLIDAGQFQQTFEDLNIADGVYYLQLIADKMQVTKKVVVVR